MIPKTTGKGLFLPAAFLSAILLHGALIFIWKIPAYQPPEFAIAAGDTSLEVELVADSQPPETISVQTTAPAATPEPAPTPEATPPPAPEPAPTPQGEPKPAPEKKPTQIPPSTPPNRKASAAKKNSTLAASPSQKSSRMAGGKASKGAKSSQPGYLRNPHPTYPEAARQAGEEGVVLLRVSISATGTVTSVRLERSSGHSALDQQAITTVRERWKFKPAVEDGKRVPAEISLPVRFRLK